MSKEKKKLLREHIKSAIAITLTIAVGLLVFYIGLLFVLNFRDLKDIIVGTAMIILSLINIILLLKDLKELIEVIRNGN